MRLRRSQTMRRFPRWHRAREEYRRKDKCRSGSVDEEVVELDGRADAARDRDAPHTGGVLRGLRRTCGTRTPGAGGTGAARGRDCGHSIPPWSRGVALWASPSIRGKVVMWLTPALPPKGGESDLSHDLYAMVTSFTAADMPQAVRFVLTNRTAHCERRQGRTLRIKPYRQPRTAPDGSPPTPWHRSR